jgi:hypothetical protein
MGVFFNVLGSFTELSMHYSFGKKRAELADSSHEDLRLFLHTSRS